MSCQTLQKENCLSLNYHSRPSIFKHFWTQVPIFLLLSQTLLKTLNSSLRLNILEDQKKFIQSIPSQYYIQQL